tara:strand:- start:57 stop:569 length:513 start_codon:yes stop_codon:yes gene_type:complete
MALITLNKLALPTGSFLQVKNAIKTDRFTTTSTSELDITGLSVDITPSSTSSKFLIMAHVTVGSDPSPSSGLNLRIIRDSTTPVGVGSDGSRTPMSFATDSGQPDGNRALTNGGFTCIDEPSTTSQINYKLTMTQFNSIETVHINSNKTLTGASFDDIFTSGITVIEFKG